MENLVKAYLGFDGALSSVCLRITASTWRHIYLDDADANFVPGPVASRCCGLLGYSLFSSPFSTSHRALTLGSAPRRIWYKSIPIDSTLFCLFTDLCQHMEAYLTGMTLMPILMQSRSGVVSSGSSDDPPAVATGNRVNVLGRKKDTEVGNSLIVEGQFSKIQVKRGLQGVSLLSEESTSTSRNPTNMKLELAWGSPMYHVDDLPFNPSSLPDIYPQFCKSVESKCAICNCFKLLMSVGPLPSTDLSKIGGSPLLDQLGAKKEMGFAGGESAALGRVYKYFWKKVEP
ncbi:hypothetical protein C5167_000418 [Papaver somniferum]|uniref:Uncharacterized protein n=1 Tax=Papaver somniferum TaxID=3469 RepID=A0A4Y7KWM3_PAPSO|nr:hypothetical protein C5167_000418 [Papaver somniferum]